MKEEKADQILDLMEKMHQYNTEQFTELRNEVVENRKEIETNRHLIEGVQRGLDNVSSNYTKLSHHIALKEGVEEIAQHVGLDLDLSAA